MTTSLIGLGPSRPSWAEQAVRAGGGRVASTGEQCSGLVWLDTHDMDGLRRTLHDDPGIRWVQLASAGVEGVVRAGVVDDRRVFTCAKGAYREPVAEHALMLALAGLRRLDLRLRTTTWGEQEATSLYDSDVTVLGGGGIAETLCSLLMPFRARVTAVRRRPEPLPGAYTTVGPEQLMESLSGALVVFVALALTPETVGIIGRAQLEVMDRRAWLVNIARGAHVDTNALCDALESGTIAGAALDVVDPEPLPDGHRLWSSPRCIITPHTADTPEMLEKLLARRIAENVRRFTVGETLEGLVDATAGY